MEPTAKKKSTGKRILRIALKTVMWIFLLIVVVFLLLLTPPVQNFIARKATNYLEKKLQTRVEIGRLYLTLSGKVAIDHFYIEDRQKDTLLSAGRLRVNMSFTKLLFGKKSLDIKSILLEDATAKIRRPIVDTAFNFQFIVDAFGGGSSDSVKVSAESEAMPIAIGTVDLNRVRFVYNDVVTGNDLDAFLSHFDTRIEKFDIDKLSFIIPRTNINGITARFSQVTPLVIVPPEKIQQVKTQEPNTQAAPALMMQFGEVDLQQAKLDYRDSVGAMYANIDLAKLNIRPARPFDLDDQKFDLGDVLLENTKAIIRQDKRMVSAEKVQKNKENEAKDTMNGVVPIPSIYATNLVLHNIDLQYDDNNQPKVSQGIDYAHLKANVPAIEAKQVLFAADSIRANLTTAQMTEQSGFKLDDLRTDFLYTKDQAYLHGLYLKTPGTELKRDIAIRYESIEALAADIGNMAITADIEDSRIAVRDILAFAPMLRSQPAFSNPNATWYLNTKLNGRISDLNIEYLQASGLSNTKVDLAGRITNMTDPNRFNANLVIRQLSSTRSDVVSIMPANTLPSNITLPNRFDLRGKVNGGMAKVNTDLVLATDLGNVTLKGMMQDITDAKNAVYNVVIHTSNLNLRTILQDTTLGPVTLDMTAKGRGYDLKTTEASFNGIVRSAVYNHYNYQQLRFDGNVRNHLLTAKASMSDPNITFALDGSADLAGDFPRNVKLDMMVDSIKAKELHLTPDVLTYHGKITADFASADPDNLMGNMIVTENVLVQGTQRITLDTIKVDAGKYGDTSYLQLVSDIATARVQGRYRLTQMPGIIARTIQPYYALGLDTAGRKPDPYDFTVNAVVIDKPLVRSLVPGLEKAVNVRLNSRLSSQEGMQATITATDLLMQGTEAKGLNVTINTTDSALNVNAVAQQIRSGSAIQLDSTFVTAAIANNIVDFDVAIRDGAQKDKFTLGGLLKQERNGDLVFSLNPNELLLMYDRWNVSPENKIRIGSNGGYNATNFTLSQSGQQVSINSTSADLNAPMDVKFTSLRLSTFTEMFMSDSTMIDGVLNGQLNLRNLATTPGFTGDLKVTDFSFHKDTIGNVDIKAENRAGNTYAGTVTVSGKGNDAVIDGIYNANSSTFDATMDLRRLPMKTIEIMSNGALRYASGDVNGRFKLTGTPTKPRINGDLNFNQAAFNVSMLNSYFTINQEKIRFTDNGLVFDRFQVKDSTGNNLTVDGTVATTNYTNYKFNLAIDANDFKALNSTRKDNKLFWGQLYFTTNLQVGGTEASPSVEGRLAVNDKTKMTITLPQNDPGVVDREGIIEFVDMDAPNTDSLFMAAVDSLNRSFITGMDINLNVEVDKNAEFNIIVDEGNGDFLNLKGAAQINTGIDPSGKINMVGQYEVEQGAYQLSFNMIKRKFDIEKGSKIVWEGEPTAATLDITAKYIAKAAPFDLMNGNLEPTEKNYYLQRLPFDVLLKMEGPLLKPIITFDIQLPNNQNYGGVRADVLADTRTRLEQLRQNTGDMNKQVFALLLLNRFVGENPFASSTGGGNVGENLIRQSVSALMADQLNRLAEGLISGVDINFGIESNDDYTSGERQSRTDLNVGLSKRLLNNRLTITVGSDITLDGPAPTNNSSMIGGNVAVDYSLSADGRYKIRAYTTNDYQGVIDGYVVESGVGFIITLDYNHFRQIFMSRRRQEEERKKRREQRLREEQEAQKNAGNATSNE